MLAAKQPLCAVGQTPTLRARVDSAACGAHAQSTHACRKKNQSSMIRHIQITLPGMSVPNAESACQLYQHHLLHRTKKETTGLSCLNFCMSVHPAGKTKKDNVLQMFKISIVQLSKFQQKTNTKNNMGTTNSKNLKKPTRPQI